MWGGQKCGGMYSRSVSTHSSSSIVNGPCWPLVLGNMPIGQGAPSCPRYTWNLACQKILHAAIISHRQGNHLPVLGRNCQRSNQSTVVAYEKVDFGAAPKSTWCKTKDFRSNQSICIYILSLLHTEHVHRSGGPSKSKTVQRNSSLCCSHSWM